MAGSVGHGLWTAWTSDLQSHMIVSDVQDTVVHRHKDALS